MLSLFWAQEVGKKTFTQQWSVLLVDLLTLCCSSHFLYSVSKRRLQLAWRVCERFLMSFRDSFVMTTSDTWIVFLTFSALPEIMYPGVVICILEVISTGEVCSESTLLLSKFGLAVATLLPNAPAP